MIAVDVLEREISGRCSDSIGELIEARAEQTPDAVSIASPGRAALSFARLREQVMYVVRTLNAMGVGRNDRVAIVVPNGPEMAVAFVAVSAAATSAPLNPNYKAAEFDFYLSDLNAKALILQSGMDCPAREVAVSRGVPIIELSPVQDTEAGIFTLTGGDHLPPVQTGFARPEDTALVLHTSGTTSRPKIVPLSHMNVCASARNIHATLGLTESDRCLNVMPLFHIHGLMGAALSSLTAGASVVCTAGFKEEEFFDCLTRYQPTWYTAVPTIHQAVIAGSRENKDAIAGSKLRFIRSSSSALPAPVMAELEELFNAPVIEAYGMTEASHQMASNPLPPGRRKPGSVGVSAGPQVAVMDEVGRILSPGETGEIVIRGDNVMGGYENNPAANKSAFTDGWFRTGDQGYFDQDGYLFITGRLKEIINRGGEKISPREVDDVLMEHPAVRQVVTFAAPHPTLGEDVAAAVVLRDKASADESEIRRFAASRLAEFKVPRQVVIIDEIPKGPTGKLQRIGLAEKLGLTGQGADRRFVEPRNDLERRLADAWARVLRVEKIGITDDFFDLGGNSILAAQLIREIAAAFGHDLSPAVLLQAGTIEQQAEILRQDDSLGLSSLVAIQPHGLKPPLFCVHEVGGYLYYRDLSRHLGTDQPFYGLQPRGLDGRRMLDTRIEEMAVHYITELRKVQPKGPYFLGGFSFGGVVAFEMARQLRDANQEVALVALFDAYAPGYVPEVGKHETGTPSERLRERFLRHRGAIQGLTLREKISYVLTRARALLSERTRGFIARLTDRIGRRTWKASYRLHLLIGRQFPQAYRYVAEASRQALRSYKPRAYDGKVTLFRSADQSGDPALGWSALAGAGLEIHEVPGNHRSIVREPSVRALAEKLGACLEDGRRFED